MHYITSDIIKACAQHSVLHSVKQDHKKGVWSNEFQLTKPVASPAARRCIPLAMVTHFIAALWMCKRITHCSPGKTLELESAGR